MLNDKRSQRQTQHFLFEGIVCVKEMLKLAPGRGRVIMAGVARGLSGQSLSSGKGAVVRKRGSGFCAKDLKEWGDTRLRTTTRSEWLA